MKSYFFYSRDFHKFLFTRHGTGALLPSVIRIEQPQRHSPMLAEYDF